MASEQRRAEPHAFLIAERDDFDCERQALSGRMQAPDAFDRAEDPEDAVVAAGVAHAVHVRAGKQGWGAGAGAFVPPDRVAERVEGG